MSVSSALQRYGGILIRPRATLQALEEGEGRFDWWILAALFLLGSQLQHLTETVARFLVFDSFWLLVNGLAIALLTPLFVGLVVESVVGASRSRFRHLPLVALVLVSSVGNLLRSAGVTLPGPRYLPEMLGAAWALGLAAWIRANMPAEGSRSSGADVQTPASGAELNGD